MGGVTSAVHNAVRGPADVALAFAARAFVNRRLQGIADVTDLTIDTLAQSIRLRAVLNGETVPVDVDVRRYAIEPSRDGAMVTVMDAAASRPWINEALRAFVVGRPLHIPGKAAVALRLLA